MRLIQFKEKGEIRLGILLENGVVDVAKESPTAPRTMLEAMALGGDLIPMLTKIAENCTDLIPESSIEYAAPVTAPEKILCIGLNYKKHVMESGKWDKLPEYPVVFGKFNNTLIGHKAPVKRCKASAKHDYEAEITIVIGRECKEVSKEEALDYVFGYTLANDISARDLQSRTPQWTLGKGCDTFCPVGPCIATADAVPHDGMHMIGYKNGEVRQEGDSNDLIFDIPTLVSYISQAMTLRPGDLILTGTPAGVIGGRPAGQQDWLAPGDTVSVYVEQIGTLKNPIED